MSQEQVILQVLREVGILDRIRERVSSDRELVELFCDRFGDLVEIIENETASRVSSPGRP